jgi:hypothetical protein
LSGDIFERRDTGRKETRRQEIGAYRLSVMFFRREILFLRKVPRILGTSLVLPVVDLTAELFNNVPATYK